MLAEKVGAGIQLYKKVLYEQFVFCSPEHRSSARHTDCVQHVGSQAVLGRSSPIVSVDTRQHKHTLELNDNPSRAKVFTL